MKLFILCFLTISYSMGADILFIGDSHTAGPFGKLLHKELAKSHNVTTLGHASSAPIHWMSDEVFKLSGGVFNELKNHGVIYKNPTPTHWREKVIVPKFLPLLEDTAYHSAWKGNAFKPSHIIIALGANDARSISDENGNIRATTYELRQKAIIDMLDALNIPCAWIGPPNGIKKPAANQNVLYTYLEESVIGKCEFMSSNHYIVRGCDGVHMNCPSEMDNARKWVQEAFLFIQNKLLQ